MQRIAEFARRRPVPLAIVALAIAVVLTVGLFEKSSIITALRPGDEIVLDLSRDYKIRPHSSVVKIAGTQVGVVSSVDDSSSGGASVTLKLDDGARELLGSDPRAVVRPTTVLGGAYFIQLFPGGTRDAEAPDTIRANRIELPQELDRILPAVPGDAQKGLQGTVASLDKAFQTGTGNALDHLVTDAPATLAPTGRVADALRGVRQDTDVAALVDNLQKTSHILTATPGQLGDITQAFARTSHVLGTQADAVDQTVAGLPDTLKATQTGADRLGTTLDKVKDTADDARPAAQELAPVVNDLAPALHDLRPVVSGTRAVLHDARPLLNDLEPTAENGTDILNKVNGPVLDRINGPVLDTLNSRWQGVGPKYPHGGDGNKVYEEIGYTFSHLNGLVSPFTSSGHTLVLQVGAASTSVEGTSPMAQALQDYLSEGAGPPNRGPGPGPPPAVQLPQPLAGLGGPQPPAQQTHGKPEER